MLMMNGGGRVMRRLISALIGSCLVVGGVACSPNANNPDGGNTVTTDCGDGGSVTLTVNAPSCLWPPDHEMVLFTLNDVTATSTDCNLPTLSVVSVTSNQAEHHHGSGQTWPDYTFNSTGVCLRAEREGCSKDPRVYTITFEATDGNTSVQQSVQVVVEHDQNGVACPPIDPSRIVGENDPRCN
jgi:hypothetical protein